MPLEGTLAILREQTEEDQPFLVALRNDMDTQAWSKSLPPDTTVSMYMKRFAAREFSFDPDEGRFTLVHKETGELAGTISYSSLERRFAATLGIIVAKKFWGTGIAYDAQEVLLKFLFEELGLRVARLWTHSGNSQAVGLAQKSGFQPSGRMRQAVYKNGGLYDTCVMDLLREEYYARHPELTDRLPPL